jgi:hypothetical protein
MLPSLPQPPRRLTKRNGLFERCGDHDHAEEVAKLKDEHNWKAALEVELRILRHQREAHGYEHPNVLQSLFSLAQVYLGLKRFADAEQYVQWASSGCKVVLGPGDPLTLRIDGLAAAILMARGRLRMAAERALTTITVQTEVLGADHLDTLDTRRTYGRAKGMRSPIRCQPIKEDTPYVILTNRYTALKELLGSEHVLSLQALLDVVEYYLGRFELACLEQMKPSEKKRLVSLKSNLELSWIADPLPLTKTITGAYDALWVRLSDKHPLALRAQTLRARAFLDLGDDETAEKCLRCAMADAKDALGEDDADAQAPSVQLAVLYIRHARPKDALPLLLACQPVIERTYGTGSLASADIDFLIAQAHVSQPKRMFQKVKVDGVAAGRHFERAYGVFKKDLKSEHGKREAARQGAEDYGNASG